MKVEEINKIFDSNEMKSLLKRVAAENDFRMCLNKEVMEDYRRFFANVIVCCFVVDVACGDLTEIYEDVEGFLAKKLSLKLHLKDIYNNKDKVAEFFNKMLGKSQIYFHGTLSNMENSVLGQKDNNYIKIQLCKSINDVYCKYGIYAAFESGIRDFEDNNFWLTRSPGSVCFYALQSPEYFARFCSRSDYYKQDIFKYDRIAYYRKDFWACKQNIKTETKDFNFNKQERKSILKNFKALWKNVVVKDMANIIFMCEINKDNTQSFAEDEMLLDMLLKFFKEDNFCFDLAKFKKSFKGKIALPDVKPYLKHQHPVIDKKFVIFDNKKYYPDFYIDCKYSKHLYFSFKEDEHFETINKNIRLNDKTLLIKLVNEARPNSKAAKQFFKMQNLPSVKNVVEFYKKEFSIKVKQLEKEKNFEIKKQIVKQICEDVGLKYVVSAKYNQYFKDINQYYIKTYRSLLGVKLFEHYDGIADVTDEKLNQLLAIYKDILSKKDILKENLPLKAFNREFDFIK